MSVVVGFPGVLTMLPSHGSSVPNQRVYSMFIVLYACLNVWVCLLDLCASATARLEQVEQATKLRHKPGMVKAEGGICQTLLNIRTFVTHAHIF